MQLKERLNLLDYSLPTNQVGLQSRLKATIEIYLLLIGAFAFLEKITPPNYPKLKYFIAHSGIVAGDLTCFFLCKSYKEFKFKKLLIYFLF